MALTAQFVENILKSDPLSDPAVAPIARRALIDFFACVLGGAKDPSVDLLVQLFAAPVEGAYPLIGRAETTDIYSASLINAHAGHVLDYDDVQASVRGHPTVAIIPALLLVAVQEKRSALEFIAAYCVGLEAMAKLGASLGTKHYENGFHATATLGAIGAAAALCFLTKANHDQTARALGLAATQAQGLRLQFGYDAKPLHAGLAARAGLTAFHLAKAGLTAANDFLDQPIGFYSTFAFGAEMPEKLNENWGAPWQIIKPGLTLKAFPCCTAAHSVAQGALALYAADPDLASQIAEVTITFPPGGDAALIGNSSPKNGIEARFSPEYIFAAAITDGALKISHFDQKPTRSDLLALAAKVKRTHDETARRLSSDPTTRFIVLDIALKNGASRTLRVDGLPSLEDPRSKFTDATGNDPRFAALPDLIQIMESADDLQEINAVLHQII